MIKIKKLFAVMLAAVITVCCFSVTAAGADAIYESIYSTGKGIVSGKSYSTTLYEDGDSAEYKIKVPEKGQLKIDIALKIKYSFLYIYDSDGNEMAFPQTNIKTGGADTTLPYYTLIAWDDNAKKFEGSFTYPVEKGTYYIMFFRSWHVGNTGSGKIKFTATFTPETADDSNESYISVPIKKGSEVSLQVYGSGDKAEWSSSNPAVGTITSSGIFKAKKTGETIITASLDSGTIKLHIRVVA